LTIKKFIVFSIVVHISVLVGMYFIPEAKKGKPAPFFARLVTPEEMQKNEIKPALPPPGMKKTEPLRPPRKIPAPPVRPRPLPSPEKPIVPGMGKETGRPLPEGVYPKPEDKTKGEGSNGNRLPRTGAAEKAERQDKPGYSLREKLYDPEVIGDIAMRDAGGQPKKEDSITFDTSDYRYAGYMRKLKDKIESIWVYPPEAIARGLYGDLKIRFTILKSGKLGAVELVRTSGYKTLDDAAIKALKEGEPYWPIPEQWGRESYTILGHFVYSIYGSSLR
jgi:protein TonB